MQFKFVSGIPAALFDNYIKYQLSQTKQGSYYCVRWNKSLEKYFASGEEVSSYAWTGLLHTVGEFGYKRVGNVGEVGEFAVKGDIISLWLPGFPDPLRLSFFGDELEAINSYDALTGRRIAEFKSIELFDLKYLETQSDLDNICLLLPQGQKQVAISEEVRVLVPETDAGQFKISEGYDFTPPTLYFSRFDLLAEDLKRYKSQGFKVNIFTHHKLELEHTPPTYIVTKLSCDLPLSDPETFEIGFISAKYKLVVLTDRELFGTIFISQRQRKQLKSSEAQKLLNQLEGEIEVGDYIVHEDYGVGIYQGFTQEEGSDYLKLEYAAGDELFVPLEQINKLTKYIGEQGQLVEITRLGKTEWQALKKKVKAQVAIAAKELARHYAQVNIAQAKPVELEDSESYQNFLADFPYQETTDQIKAEREILSDLAQAKPMNRLLIGDVGFGKTELMLRAAFKMLEAGSQVVVLCPTTVLALQHYHTFSRRLASHPFNLALLSRHNSQAENRQQVDKINAGKIDLVIGTHRLLTSDFLPSKLGLLIVDEEQRFGVKQKEKIRKLEYGVHTLYVSATPIPRTLSMALAAIKDISLINTPPQGRKPVKTEVAKLSWSKIAVAINTELARGGQVLFVHNQIETISSIRAQLEGILPGVRFAIAHGQMPSSKLDEIMEDFYQGKTDCLIATTIIENGLDMPNVNTIIVNNAQRLGLAQMYQLRGRVGRSSKQAFAYFFYHGRDLPAQPELQMALEPEEKPELKPAKYLERLETILSSQELGSGFRIASRDLEIRGAGNLLGAEQHGNITKVGYGLYMQMLAEEIEQLKAQPVSGN